MIAPAYQRDGVMLYHADCLDVLPQLTGVDAVITDPPYCSGGSLEAQKNTAGQGLRTQTMSRDDFEWFSADNMTTGGLVWLIRSVLVQARRMMNPNRSAFVFSDWRMVPFLAPALESSGLRYRNMIVWDKGSAGLGMGFKPSHEIVLEYTNGSTEYAARTGQNVIRSRRVTPSDREHACQKPVDVITKLIEVAVSANGTVLDAFMGAGSVGIACIRTGRRFIGIEIDAKYFEIARDRIDRELNQGVLAL